MVLDTCLGIQNQLSDWVYLFIWWNDSKPANWYFWRKKFRFWPSSVIQGTPHIFFFEFFSMAKFSSSIELFSIKLQTKESRRFFPGGWSLWPPPLDLQGLKKWGLYIMTHFGSNFFYSTLGGSNFFRVCWRGTPVERAYLQAFNNYSDAI